MPQPGWYYRLSQYFRELFGQKVYKIPLDAGMTCPNLDGAKSSQGCIFCHNPGFSPGALSRETNDRTASIAEQVRKFQLRSEQRKKNPGAQGQEQGVPAGFTPRRFYLAYFQSFSNTYAPLSTLRQLYQEALSVPGVVGLSVATRPDCLQEDVLDLLAEYGSKHHVWLELGLQTFHDATLKRINRGHDFACFRDAVLESERRGLRVCVHIINGLPGEGRREMLETARVLAGLPVKGIKFHQLQVMESTDLARLYRQGELRLLNAEEYLEILCDQLELLRQDIVVHRLMSEVTREELLLAPRWDVSRADFARKVEQTLKARNSCQGRHVPVNDTG